MLKSKLPRDIELLSAYLDQQLKPRERVRLEARLKTDQILQSELTSLRRTKIILQSLPVRRAPRNFSLTPAMVGIRQASPRRSYLGVVPALAVILLLFVLVGDFLFVPEYFGMFPVSQNLPAVEEEMLPIEPFALEMAEGETLVFSTETPSLKEQLVEKEVSAVEEMEAMEVEAPAEELQPEALADTLPEETPNVAEAARMAEEVEEYKVGEAEESLMAEQAADQEIQAADELGESAGLSATQIVMIPPTDESSLGLEDTSIEQDVPSEKLILREPDQGVLWSQLLIWIVEVVLLLIIVISGSLYIYNRKNP